MSLMQTAEDIQKVFAFDHLPEHLIRHSRMFYEMAMSIHDHLPPSDERTLALRKLWEAKNYAVWCAANA